MVNPRKEKVWIRVGIEFATGDSIKDRSEPVLPGRDGRSVSDGLEVTST